MVAVAPDHALELAHLLGARSHQAVLVEDEQARPRREEVGDRQALLLAAG